ncbi:hypothetical protein LDI01_15110 [Lentilactobacillus diolivorans]|uniref:Uncharacterized protein n=1 Tax=Lentilactobacillus diolivorans TaxID=179838 RepID=A0ABQ0XCV2_9LACO|nr:hypothetical protein LDI01_15110 [Lentilactobacillus diolivorans]
MVFKKMIGKKLHFQPVKLYIVQRYREIGKHLQCSADINYDGDKLTTGYL